MLALRFANGLYEPIWNRNNVEYVQIDVPETLSIGSRAGFYEGTGAYRDMVVTHLLQLLSFVAMEPPASLTSEHLVAEKMKVFEAISRSSPGPLSAASTRATAGDEGVAADSDTETFVAVRVEIDNWRWAGRALLPADRQVLGRVPASGRARFPGAADADVPRARSSTRGRTNSSSSSPNRARSPPTSRPRCRGRRWSSARRG